MADINFEAAETALAARRTGAHPHAWAEARAFADWQQMLAEVKPDAVIVGLPPKAHGHIQAPKDIEINLARAGFAMFIEKPLSIADPAVVAKVAAELRRCGTIVSVGYMFRYAAAIARLRKVIEAAPGGPRVFIARYNCAYSEINSLDWWDSRRSGGPIIEQATHFLDLARYLGGAVDSSSIQVTRIPADGPLSELTDMPVDATGQPLDAQIPRGLRNPCATLAQWRFTSGAVGSLAHGVLLHQKKYEAALEVWADGVRCILEDPYSGGRLGIRQSGCEETQWESFDDDCYLAEDNAFIEAVRSGSPAPIRSTYDDALETYRLSWLITHGNSAAP